MNRDNKDKWFARQWHRNRRMGGKDPMTNKNEMVQFTMRKSNMYQKFEKEGVKFVSRLVETI